MANVALVNPQIVTSRWNAAYRNTDDIAIRHSLAQLSSVLKREGHNVSLIDFRHLRGWPDYEERLRQIRPDAICVTAHTCERDAALETARRGRAIDPRVFLIAGGIDPTMFPDVYLHEDQYDLVIQGEGEITLPKMLSKLPSRGTFLYGEMPDLDRLPFADREIWPDYAMRTTKNMLNFPGELPQIDMILQRGCPWQCKFCCGPGEQNLYTKQVGDKRVFNFRARGVESVMEELNQLHARYPFRSIIFHDDQFIIREKWVAEFCEGMHRHSFAKRGVKFWAAVRADVICRHGEPGGLMEQMRDAGLLVVSIGFESFSDRLLKWMAKGTTREQNFRAAEIAKRLGIRVYSNFILGMPGPDGVWRVEDDLETLAAVQKIQPDVASPSFFSPIPGSPFYEHYAKSGLMKIKDSDAIGQRNPNLGKIDGVDYQKLDRLMDSYLARYRSSNPLKHAAKILLKRAGLFDPARRWWRAWTENQEPVSGKKL